jgi:hypothetical protein
MNRSHVIRYLLTVAAVFLLAASLAVAQQPTVALPFFVLKDNNGTIVGPVLEANSSVIVGLRNPSNGEPFILQMHPQRFRNPRVLDVYFTGLNCTGTPYVQDPDDSNQVLVQLRGSVYVAATSDGSISLEPDIVVTNKFAAGTGGDNSGILMTRYRVGNINLVGTCDSSVTSNPTIEAEVALDLSSLVTPFRVE